MTPVRAPFSHSSVSRFGSYEKEPSPCPLPWEGRGGNYAKQAGINDSSYDGLLDSGKQLAYEFPPYGRTRPVASSRVQMEATKIYFIVFGVLTIAGGIMGYVKAGSVASIIAGSVTGVLLLVAAFLLPEYRAAGLATAFIISLLLAAQFLPKFFRTGRLMPAGIMSLLSVIGLVVALVTWIKK
jgi:uncharacterized membrane protein (UPF0136 family)